MSMISTRKAVLIAALGMSATFAAGFALAAPVHMEAALKALQTAKEELRAAEADKGGHRAKAIDLVEQAIAETQAGIGKQN